MSEQLRRLRILARVVQGVTLAVGLILAAAGIVYLTVTASDLPSWYPGNVAITTSAHHVSRGWVLLVAAVAAWAVCGVATWAVAASVGTDDIESPATTVDKPVESVDP